MKGAGCGHSKADPQRSFVNVFAKTFVTFVYSSSYHNHRKSNECTISSNIWGDPQLNLTSCREKKNNRFIQRFIETNVYEVKNKINSALPHLDPVIVRGFPADVVILELHIVHPTVHKLHQKKKNVSQTLRIQIMYAAKTV